MARGTTAAYLGSFLARLRLPNSIQFSTRNHRLRTLPGLRSHHCSDLSLLQAGRTFPVSGRALVGDGREAWTLLPPPRRAGHFHRLPAGQRREAWLRICHDRLQLEGVFWFLPPHRRPARSGPTRAPPASRSLVDMQSLGSHDRQHKLWPAYPLRITARPRILPDLGPSHKRTRLARTGSVVVHSDVGSGSGWLNDNVRERARIPGTTSGQG